VEIPAGGRALVKTGIAISLPSGYYGRVAPRSGLAVKNGIDVGAGVIDSDYRGEVGVLLFNFGSEVFRAEAGTRVAQLIVEPMVLVQPVEVSDLDDTQRGAGGFGSTG
jgi:deoxyuridine 5'-triphosphate nucleotidohydrolase